MKSFLEVLGVKKSNIKIFVTHTPNRKSQMIENNIFQHIVAGAVYNKGEVSILADNTGDNISEKNKSYCELTTQYWAWKNVEADYYGFFHYRRYLSFSDKIIKEGDWGTIEYPFLTDEVIKELCLNEESIREKVEQYDFLIAKHIDTKVMDGAKSIYEHYSNGYELHIEDYDLMLKIIDEKYPFLSECANKYTKGRKFYPCNMFIMKKELFNEFSEIMFGVLDEFERRADMSKYSREAYRVTGHLGERLTGIFYEYISQKGHKKCSELQVALFKNIELEEKILPFTEQNNIPIVLAANNFYVPYLSVCLQSIYNNISEKNNYDIVVFHTDITEENKNNLKSMASIYKNIRLSFINVNRRVYNYRLQAKEHITTETFYRFLILDIMKSYSKVVYIDCDIIVKADIAELYNENIGNNLIAAASDPDFLGQINDGHKDTMDYVKKIMKLKNPYEYFQAGVLIFNVDELNKITTVKKLFDMADTGLYKYSDQDILNIICEGRVYKLDMTWNFITDCERNRYAHVIRYAPRDIMTMYEESRKSPKIIHYAGYLKPWHRPSEDFAIEFWRIARITPFYEEILYRMMEGNAWHVTHSIVGKHRIHNLVSKEKIYKIYEKIWPKGSRGRRFIRMYIKKWFIK